MTTRTVTAGLCSLAFACGPVLAAEGADDVLYSPLYVKNLSPVASLLGLPSQADARGVARGAWEWRLNGSVASHYVSDGISDRSSSEPGFGVGDGAGVVVDPERLLLDGETQRLALNARYGFAEGWELQLELPWVWQNGGAFDSAIDGWHDFWGMPDNGRGDAPGDRIAYRYGDPLLHFNLDSSRSGLGDATLALQRRIYRSDGVAVAAAAGYKFGTGDPDDFTGGGEGDAFLALRLSDTDAGALGWYGQFGYLRAGQVAALGPRQERDLWFAGAGLAWRVAQDWSLLAQLDAHAAPMDSALDALGSEAVMLSAGARWRFSRHWSAEFSLVEDIAVETAPDVTFQFGVRYLGGLD